MKRYCWIHAKFESIYLYLYNSISTYGWSWPSFRRFTLNIYTMQDEAWKCNSSWIRGRYVWSKRVTIQFICNEDEISQVNPIPGGMSNDGEDGRRQGRRFGCLETELTRNRWAVTVWCWLLRNMCWVSTNNTNPYPNYLSNLSQIFSTSSIQ